MQQSASDDSDSDSDDEIRRLEEEIQKMKRLKELKRAKKAKAQKQAADPVVAPAAKQQNKVPGPAAGEGGPARFGATKCPAQRLNTPLSPPHHRGQTSAPAACSSLHRAHPCVCHPAAPRAVLGLRASAFGRLGVWSRSNLTREVVPWPCCAAAGSRRHTEVSGSPSPSGKRRRVGSASVVSRSARSEHSQHSGAGAARRC